MHEKIRWYLGDDGRLVGESRKPDEDGCPLLYYIGESAYACGPENGATLTADPGLLDGIHTFTGVVEAIAHVESLEA